MRAEIINGAMVLAAAMIQAKIATTGWHPTTGIVGEDEEQIITTALRISREIFIKAHEKPLTPSETALLFGGL